MLRDFHGAVTIRFEAGKAWHAETETRRMWQYKDLPEEIAGLAEPDRNRAPRYCAGRIIVLQGTLTGTTAPKPQGDGLRMG